MLRHTITLYAAYLQRLHIIILRV